MKWHGPFSYKVPSTVDRSSIYVDWSEDHENIRNRTGVYLLVVNTNRGRNINYVGTAHGAGGFQNRLETSTDSHLHCYVDGRYMLKDPESLVQGYFKPLNYGLLNLELSMRGPQGIQHEKLPQDLVTKIQQVHDLGMENRKILLPLIKETSSFQNLLISDPDCVVEWKRRLLGGMSVRNPPSLFKKSSEVWKQLNKHLKNYYLKHFFYNIDGPNIGYRMLELHEMYLCPVDDKSQSFALEGTIFQSICHHPIQWVREFNGYHLVQPLQHGFPKNLDALKTDCGVGYQFGGDQVDLIFD